MGSNTSKPTSEPVVNSFKNELDGCGSSDPRSPTPEITRTPLQNKSGAKHNITKNMDLRKTFESGKVEEKLIHNNPILSAVIKNHLQSYDPRSPTQDFERTPIVVGKVDELANDKNLLRLQCDNMGSPILRADNEDNCESCTETYDKSPDLVVSRNLCEGFFNITFDDTLKESEEPLGSSTASNEAIESNISKVDNKPSQLLETNFDYVENDNNNFKNCEDNDIIADNEDSDKNKDSKDDTEINDSNKSDDIDKVPIFKLLNVDPRSPSIGIERTPIVVAKVEDVSNEGNVENMSDDSLIKVLQCTNAELRQNVNKPDKNVEGLLVYEDETPNINDTPKKSKSTSNSGSRTPLSCMKNKADAGHARSKSANTLFDPKNQNGLSKIPKRVSHIPRLKCLSKQVNPGSTISLKSITKGGALGGDCENTPPHTHRDIWDKDNSIVL